MKTILYYVVLITILIGVSIGAYVFNRWFNYSFMYKTSVEQTVCEMVKPNLLKDPAICSKYLPKR